MHEKTNSHELFLCMDYGNTMVRRTNASCWIGGGVNCPREKTTFAENIQTNLLYLDVAASLPVRDSVLLRSPCFFTQLCTATELTELETFLSGCTHLSHDILSLKF